MGEQSGEPEPPIAQVLKSKSFGVDPVTAILLRQLVVFYVWCRACIDHMMTFLNFP